MIWAENKLSNFFLLNRLNALSISFFPLIGEVGCNPITFLNLTLVFSKNFIECNQAESEVELSLAYFFGLIIVLAPIFYA